MRPSHFDCIERVADCLPRLGNVWDGGSTMASHGAVASHRQPPHRILLFIALCSITAAVIFTAVSWRGAEWSHAPRGEFSVRGSHIYDPSGRDFIAHGVNISGNEEQYAMR